MNHEEATRFFDDLGELVPDRRPAMAELISSGQVAERRRSRTMLALVVASVGLVVAGGAIAQQLVDADGESPGEGNVAEVPQAPAGMRLVGMSGVVVAVPDSWVVAENGCARETGVVWRYPDVVRPGSPGCPEAPTSGESASLGVGDLNSVEGGHLSPEMTLDGAPVQGAAVRQGSGTNDYQEPQYCMAVPDSTVEKCSMLFGVPSRGVFFILRIFDEDARSQLATIRESLQLLPEGVTTVPFVEPGIPVEEARSIVEAAGLEVSTDAASPTAPLAGVDPWPGSAVRVGDVVNLTAQAGEPDPSEPPTTATSESVPVYYVGDTPQGPRLYREFHRPRGTDVLSAAVDMAVSEPPLDPDYQMPWTDAVHATASFDGEVITVDLTAADKPGMGVYDPFPGMTQSEAKLALQQLIFTAQGALSERQVPVQFLIDGQHTDRVLGQPASEPLANGPLRQTLSLLNIDSPAEGAVISGDTLAVSGLANAYESNVVIRLQRHQGTDIVFEKPIMAAGFSLGKGGKLYPFEASFDIADVEPGEYLLTAMTEDPFEGHEQYTNDKVITIQ